jgi:hypothetical protein
VSLAFARDRDLGYAREVEDRWMRRDGIDEHSVYANEQVIKVLERFSRLDHGGVVRRFGFPNGPIESLLGRFAFFLEPRDHHLSGSPDVRWHRYLFDSGSRSISWWRTTAKSSPLLAPEYTIGRISATRRSCSRRLALDVLARLDTRYATR